MPESKKDLNGLYKNANSMETLKVSMPKIHGNQKVKSFHRKFPFKPALFLVLWVIGN